MAAAEDRPVLEAVKEAVQMGIAEATLCGDEARSARSQKRLSWM